MVKKDNVSQIASVLETRYPGTTALAFTDPFTLLVAAILAAQCTDERVNRVTATLFERYPTPEAFASASLEEIEEAIHSTGFYRQKAKALQRCCHELATKFEGRVPHTVEELTRLPGIGRKTANLVLGNALGIAGIFVDTHVKRVARRLGLTSNSDPDKIERDLSALIPARSQVTFSNNLTYLGREYCTARKPRCGSCIAETWCPRILGEPKTHLSR